MRKTLSALFLAFTALWSSAQTTIYLTTGGRSATATLADTDAAHTLAATLAQGPVTINMTDYGGFEKVGALPRSFPASDTRITTVPGDIMLYQGNQMVIFYGSNTWSYTRLGCLDGATAESVRAFLGTGAISLTISLEPVSGLEAVKEESNGSSIYDLNGINVTGETNKPGIYIIDGKKTLVR